jgi:ribosomal protein S18 acetylase RimI-like enzyme
MAQVRTMRADELAHACEIVAGQGLCERKEGLAMRLGPIAAVTTSDFLVAESGGELVGVLLSTFDGFSHLVSYMAVAPGHERRGIGRLLLEELVRRTRERGGRNIVAASWLTAAGFYHKQGFHVPGAVFLVRDVRPS